MDIFMHNVLSRLDKNSQLNKLDRLLNWNRIDNILRSSNLRSKEGRDGYSPLLLFKCLLLQTWHNLSDRELEHGLNVRLDFMAFAHINSFDSIPDYSTICRFRKALIKNNLLKPLFKEVNKQLQSHGLMVNSADCAVVDATVVSAASRPSKTLKDVALDRHEDDYVKQEIVYSKDSEARWLKKGFKFYFGYKVFSVCNTDGEIINIACSPANEGESPKLPSLLAEVKAKSVLADKGYASKSNRDYLRSRNIYDGIMKKASRNNPLSHADRKHNKEISKVRFVVERSFGTLKRRFSMDRFRYIGLEKVSFEATMKAMCLNILQSVNKIRSIS